MKILLTSAIVGLSLSWNTLLASSFEKQPNDVIRNESTFLNTRDAISLSLTSTSNYNALMPFVIINSPEGVTLQDGSVKFFPNVIRDRQVNQILRFNNFSFWTNSTDKAEEFIAMTQAGQPQGVQANYVDTIGSVMDAFVDEDNATLYVNAYQGFYMWTPASGWSDVEFGWNDYENLMTQIAPGVFSYQQHHSSEITIFKVGNSQLSNEEMKQLFLNSYVDSWCDAASLEFVFVDPAFRAL